MGGYQATARRGWVSSSLCVSRNCCDCLLQNLCSNKRSECEGEPARLSEWHRLPRSVAWRAADDVTSANLNGVLAGDDATVFWRAGEENREVRFQGCYYLSSQIQVLTVGRYSCQQWVRAMEVWIQAIIGPFSRCPCTPLSLGRRNDGAWCCSSVVIMCQCWDGSSQINFASSCLCRAFAKLKCEIFIQG